MNGISTTLDGMQPMKFYSQSSNTKGYHRLAQQQVAVEQLKAPPPEHH